MDSGPSAGMTTKLKSQQLGLDHIRKRRDLAQHRFIDMVIDPHQADRLPRGCDAAIVEIGDVDLRIAQRAA